MRPSTKKYKISKRTCQKTQQLKLKKNALGGISNRLEDEEECIGKLEESIMESNQAEQKKQ